MSFRTRLFLAFLTAVLIPLGILAWGVRREMAARLAGEYDRRIAALIGVISADVAAESRAIGARLAALASDLSEDSRVRLAARGDPEARRWLIDYATPAMRASGLDLLQVQDGGGRIVSSGHFRNEFDRPASRFADAVAAAGPGGALVQSATPDREFVALARADSVRIGGERYILVGGVSLDSTRLARLSRDPDLRVALAFPHHSAAESSGERVAAQLAFPFVDGRSSEVNPLPDGSADSARFTVLQRAGTLDALRRGVDLWFAVAGVIVLCLAVLLAFGLSLQVSRPVGELARKTAAIDLDRLDQDFATDRPDEIGALSRVLAAMSERLRASAVRLREVERRAAVGDIARQVNHDVKNGLVPIRHVLRHLEQVARDDPSALPGTFADRRGTLESSVSYLEQLASKYARLSPPLGQDVSDPNAVVRTVAGGTNPREGELVLELAPDVPPVRADSIVLRRILENLVGNAVDSLAGDDGRVTLRTERLERPLRARLTVLDTGRGMTRAELDRAFEDFHTTKPGGTGLGLSVVRRLVADLEGTLRVETVPGQGTQISIELPGVEPP